MRLLSLHEAGMWADGAIITVHCKLQMAKPSWPTDNQPQLCFSQSIFGSLLLAGGMARIP
jgi:hypothetical protein